jgi:hypothetical protein
MNLHRIVTHAVAVTFGLALGLTGSSFATTETPTRACGAADDTVCIVGDPGAPYEVRYLEDNHFCVDYNYGGTPSTRCEEYWPFARPEIGAGALPARPQLPAGLTPSSRPCANRLDTNCVNRELRSIRYVDEGKFCVYHDFTHHARCESYWPFGRPVVNAARAKLAG